MKKLFAILMASLMATGAFCQVRYPNFQDTLIKSIHEHAVPGSSVFAIPQLDSNTGYQMVKDGIIMLGGQTKLVRNGDLYRLDSPVTLKNGSIIMTDGIIRMTNGSTPTLNENDFIDMNGNIRSLQKNE
jgi:hypothetical protein